jgi:hypothetical protein
MTFGTISCRLMQKQSCSSQNATQRSGAPNTLAHPPHRHIQHRHFSSSVPTTRNLDDALTAPSHREQTKSKREEKEYLYRKYKPCISMLHYIDTT